MFNKREAVFFSKLNIFHKMLLTFTVVGIIPLTCSFYIAQQTARGLIISQNTAETINSLMLVSNSVEALVQTATSLVHYVSDDENIRHMLREEAMHDANADGLSEQELRLRRLDRVNRFNRIISNLSFNIIGVRSYITIATIDGQFFTNWPYDGTFSEAYLARGDDRSGAVWMDFERNYVRTDQNNYPYVWTIGKNIINPQDRAWQGNVAISIPEQAVGRLLAADSLQKRAILDMHGRMIATTHQDWIGENFDALYNASFPDEASGSFQIVDENGERILITYVAHHGWRIVDVKRYETIMSQLNRTRNHLLMLNVLCVLAFVTMAAIIARGISKPLRRLAMQMRCSDFNSSPIGEYKTKRDEVGILEDSFHIMVNKNQELMARNIQNERDKRDAELKALQAQISPHFLFNTLNCIRWAAINQHNQKAADMALALSNLLRMTVINGDELITIEAEIVNLQNYADLFRMRQAVAFTFTETIPQTLKSYRIPKLLLQPLVENALIHGFEGMAEGGVITMTGESTNDGVTISIADNGSGIAPASAKSKRLAKKAQFSGIGMSNVDERIKLNFGKQYGLTVESKPGVGTTVKLFLPPHHIGGDVLD